METRQRVPGRTEEGAGHLVKGITQYLRDRFPQEAQTDFTCGSETKQLLVHDVRFRLRHLQDWERCERGIGGSLEKLRAFKRQLSQPLPDHHEDLQAEQMRCKVTPSPASLSAFTCHWKSLTHG